MNVAMVCETSVEPPQDGMPISRDNITCKIQYTANGKEDRPSCTAQHYSFPSASACAFSLFSV